jgi:hypothetical protein
MSIDSGHHVVDCLLHLLNVRYAEYCGPHNAGAIDQDNRRMRAYLIASRERLAVRSIEVDTDKAQTRSVDLL